MKKGWKIFWTVIISLTGAGVVFCIIALCLGQVDLSGMLDGGLISLPLSLIHI